MSFSIKKNRIKIECTLDSFYYKREHDAILFTETSAYLIKAKSAREFENPDGLFFKYATSFSFEPLTLEQGFKLYDSFSPALQASTTELNYGAHFKNHEKKNNLMSNQNEKSIKVFYFLQYLRTVENFIEEKQVNKKSLKI